MSPKTTINGSQILAGRGVNVYALTFAYEKRVFKPAGNKSILLGPRIGFSVQDPIDTSETRPS
jgi:hypothetical protein